MTWHPISSTCSIGKLHAIQATFISTQSQRSHAHEEAIPGTVNLRAIEGDDTAYGQALFPVPAEDPNDP